MPFPLIMLSWGVAVKGGRIRRDREGLGRGLGRIFTKHKRHTLASVVSCFVGANFCCPLCAIPTAAVSLNSDPISCFSLSCLLFSTGMTANAKYKFALSCYNSCILLCRSKVLLRLLKYYESPVFEVRILLPQN